MAGLVKSVLFPQKSQSAKQQSAKQQQTTRVAAEGSPNAAASLAKLKTSYGRASHSSDEAADTPTGTLTPRPTLTDNRFPALKTHDDLGTAATNNQTTKTPTTTPSTHHVLSPPYTPRGSSTTNDDVGGDGMGRSGESSKDDIAMQTGADAIALGVTLGRLNVKILQARDLRITSAQAQPYCICDFENTEAISKNPERKGSAEDESTSAKMRRGKAHKPPPSVRSSGIAIPKSRQSSSTNLSELMGATTTQDGGGGAGTAVAGGGGGGVGGGGESTQGDDTDDIYNAANPSWLHETVFDVTDVAPESSHELSLTIYDRIHETFLGTVTIRPELRPDLPPVEKWYRLHGRSNARDHVTGEIKVSLKYFENVDRRPLGPDDFEQLRLIGKGTFGQVYMVRKKDTGRIYAMKVLSKKVIVQKKEVAHTIGERNILVRTAGAVSPFIVALKFSFQTPTDLYLVTDYMSGGELFWHLQREGKFSESRAKFYIAELVLALDHLHNYDIVYRDLKPENILLDAKGHIALCDFGLSKANLSANATTNTFCGTTEYLAPEVLLDDAGYTKLVDFWSLGVLVFEMCCGWSPFYAEDTQQMYKNIAFGKVRFPKDTLSTEAKNFVKGLLNRNPKHRLGAERDARELMQHPFFAGVEWDALLRKQIPPPFKPRLKNESDTSNFDPVGVCS